MFRAGRCLSVLVAVVVAAGFAMSAEAGEVHLDGQTFTLADGFTIERVAGPPLVDRPIVADFDERGRLYVADSSGSSEPVQTQLREKPHRVVRLEDTNNDGVFDRSTVFADRMMFPEGALWHDGSLYVAAPPQIWKLTDTDDDGVADRREVWFDGQTLTGCANDLHGPYLGPDGMISWCKGAFAEQNHELPDGSRFVTRASHIFRRRPEGGPIEPVMTGGMDNPVDVAFSASGERFFTTTFLQHPAGGKRDGIIHAVYGGIWGKEHDPIFDPVHKWTGPEVMPVMVHLGPAAPAGLTCYESEVFGPEFRGNLFAACFNMQKVTRHVLEPDGATYRSTDSDFLVSDNRDFHPTDVIEDADGSLLVIDTGGWYKLCCPTSQLQKEDVLGAIYRIRREGAPRVEDPRGLTIDWTRVAPFEHVRLLGDSRPAVRSRSRDTLAARGAAALAVVEAVLAGADQAAEARLGAVWVASRIDQPVARALVRRALDDPDETVRQAALNAVSLHRDREAASKLLGVLREGAPRNRRAAAEALGRIGDPSAVPALLAALAEPADRFLSHALTYALIEISAPEATAKGLTGNAGSVRRAALIALDQMPNGGLDAATVAPLLATPDADLRDAASWIAGRHPEWGETLAGYYEERLRIVEALGEEERATLARQLAQFASSSAIRDLLASHLASLDTSSDSRSVALQAMTASGVKDAPASWVDAVTTVIERAEGSLVRPAVAASRSFAVPVGSDGADRLGAALTAIAADAGQPADVRLAALAAVPGGPAVLDDTLFAFLLDRLDPDAPVADRTTAADVLGRATLDTEKLTALAGSLPDAGPLVVGRILPVFLKSGDPRVGRALVDSLRGATVSLGLTEALLRPIFEPYGREIQRAAAPLFDEIAAGHAEQNTRIDELLGALDGGDIRRGQAVFNSGKAACASCHAIGYLGGEVGPDLTRIGRIRTERDLLESIAYPNASFVQSYEPVLIALLDGRVVNGLVRGDDGTTLVLATGPGEETRIDRDDIEAMQPGTVSVMPSGLDQQLTRQELADLIAFLRACQ